MTFIFLFSFIYIYLLCNYNQLNKLTMQTLLAIILVTLLLKEIIKSGKQVISIIKETFKYSENS